MYKQMTITLDNSVYEGLLRIAGQRQINQYIEGVLKAVILEEGYKAMAADEQRESEALEWCNALAKDNANEAR